VRDLSNEYAKQIAGAGLNPELIVYQVHNSVPPRGSIPAVDRRANNGHLNLARHGRSVDLVPISEGTQSIPIFLKAAATGQSLRTESQDGLCDPRVIAPVIQTLLLWILEPKRSPSCCKATNLFIRTIRQLGEIKAQS
jgi:hypothetical protein